MPQMHSIVTVAGRNRLAAKIAAGENLVFTRIALGSGDRYPSGGETTLEAEVHRGEITGSGVDEATPGAMWFDLYVDATVDTFHAQEIGLFDEDGILFALSRFDQPVPKFGPDSSSLSDNTFRIVVVFSDTENIVVNAHPIGGVSHTRTISTAAGLSGGGDLSTDRTLETDWSTLLDASALGRGNRLNIRQAESQRKVSSGDFADWLVGELSRSTRDEASRLMLASNAGRNLTEEQVQDIVGRFIEATGAGIIYDDDGNALRVEVRNASTTRRGLVERATDAEAAAGTDATRYITPAHLATAVSEIDFSGLVVTDTRTSDPTPDDCAQYRVTAQFSNRLRGGPGTWHSALTVRGWNEDYYVWQLIGLSGWEGLPNEAHEELYFRVGVGENWNEQHKLWHTGNDGTGSGLDADLLDGQHAGYYRNASNLNAGTVAAGRLPQATTQARGTVERATDAEAAAGTDTTRYITAQHMASRMALERNRVPGITDIGSYIFATVPSGGVSPGHTISGSGLRYVINRTGSTNDIYPSNSGPGVGTWRAHGNAARYYTGGDVQGTAYAACVFVRIA